MVLGELRKAEVSAEDIDILSKFDSMTIEASNIKSYCHAVQSLDLASVCDAVNRNSFILTASPFQRHFVCAPLPHAVHPQVFI